MKSGELSSESLQGKSPRAKRKLTGMENWPAQSPMIHFDNYRLRFFRIAIGGDDSIAQ